MDYQKWFFRHFAVPPETVALLKSKNIDDRTLATLARVISRRANIKYRDEIGHKWVLAELKDGFSIWLYFGEAVSNWIMKGGYEPDTTKFIMSALKPGGTFIDIGANIGWYTMNAAKYYSQHGGKVVSFEPQPEVGRRLKASVEVNGFGDIVTVHNVALSNAAGAVEMIGTEANLGWAQFKPNAAAQAIAKIEEMDHFSVTACRLDDMSLSFESIDVLKIDVEGAEVLCFQGGGKFLEKHRPLMVSEIHNKKLAGVSGVTGPEYVSFMAKFGYRCEVFEKGELVPYEPDKFSSRAYFNAVFRPE